MKAIDLERSRRHDDLADVTRPDHPAAMRAVQRRAAATPAAQQPLEPEASSSSFGAAVNAGLVHDLAASGVQGDGGTLPHLDAIQASFGKHDVSGVTAHVGGAAAEAAAGIGAVAYATGDHVAFASAPDLHLAAHEAAHVVQQRGGVRLSDGVGASGDTFEQHADAVADAVVRGESAEALLDEHAHRGPAGGPAVQRQETDECAPAPRPRPRRRHGPRTPPPAPRAPDTLEVTRAYQAMTECAQARSLELRSDQPADALAATQHEIEALVGARQGGATTPQTVILNNFWGVAYQWRISASVSRRQGAEAGSQRVRHATIGHETESTTGGETRHDASDHDTREQSASGELGGTLEEEGAGSATGTGRLGRTDTHETTRGHGSTRSHSAHDTDSISGAGDVEIDDFSYEYVVNWTLETRVAATDPEGDWCLQNMVAGMFEDAPWSVHRTTSLGLRTEHNVDLTPDPPRR